MTIGVADEDHVRDLYQDLLSSWNEQDAARYAALFTEDGSLVGFDGTPGTGQAGIQEHLAAIFADHLTASYVSKIREIRFLSDSVALLRSVVGMVPPGQRELNSATNAIQSMVAVRQGSDWRIAHFQNTPAQFHGRPEAVQELTEELRQLI